MKNTEENPLVKYWVIAVGLIAIPSLILLISAARINNLQNKLEQLTSENKKLREDIKNRTEKCSEQKEQCVWSAKILPPPAWHPEAPEVMVSNQEREMYVRWTEVPGAKKYLVHLQTLADEEVKVYVTSRTFLFLKEIPLPPGKNEAVYQVRIASVNGNDEPGEKGLPKRALIRPQAAVKPPNIKEIKVEE